MWKKLFEVWVVIFLSALLAVWIEHFGLIHPMTWDTTITPSVGWLVAVGRRANVDFPCAFPPLYWLGAGGAMKLSPTILALVHLETIWTLLTFGWTYALLRASGQKVVTAAVFAVSHQAVTNLLIAQWWYNCVTANVATLIFLSTIAWVRDDRWSIRLSYLMAICLAVMSKPNMAPPLVVVSTLLLTSSRRRWQPMLLAIVGVMLAIGFLLAVGVDIPGYLQAVTDAGKFRRPEFLWNLRSLPKLEGTLYSGDGYGALCLALYLILFLATLASRCRLLWRGWPWREATLTFVAVITAVICSMTNNEEALIDLSPAYLAIGCYVWRWPTQQKSPVWCWPTPRKIVILVMLFASCIGLAKGVARMKQKMGGSLLWEGHDPSRYSLMEDLVGIGNYPALPLGLVPFFEKTAGTRMLGDLIAQIRDLKGRNPHARIFFGPCLQWGYPATGTAPSRGLPIFWHQGCSFFDRDLPRIKEIFEWEIDIAVFHHVNEKCQYLYGLPIDFRSLSEMTAKERADPRADKLENGHSFKSTLEAMGYRVDPDPYQLHPNLLVLFRKAVPSNLRDSLTAVSRK